VGGSGFSFENQFNRAVGARRQVGSAFKPFVFAAVFENTDYTPETVIEDKPLVIETREGVWRPHNYGNVYYGKVTLRQALQKSLNSVAVQLLQKVGPESVIPIIGDALDMDEDERDKRFKPFLSAALGVYSFSPLEFAQAYAVFSNGGEKVIPYSVRRVEDSNGRVLIDNEGRMKKLRLEYDLQDRLRVVSPRTAELIDSLLHSVLQKGGTGYRAVRSSGLPVEAAGKTGTTNDYTDAWFVGYYDDLVAAVWIGYDDPSHTLGEGQAGGVVSAPIWANFISRALAY
jgi:penicillin-binding protein 1A